MEHRLIPPAQRHAPSCWQVANEAARLALETTADDIGKTAWQRDDNTEWKLIAVDTWALTGGDYLEKIPAHEWEKIPTVGAGAGECRLLKIQYPDGQGMVLAYGNVNVTFASPVQTVFNLPAGWGPSAGSIKFSPIFANDKGTVVSADAGFDIWLDATLNDTIRVLNASGTGAINFSASWPLVVES